MTVTTSYYYNIYAKRPVVLQTLRDRMDGRGRCRNRQGGGYTRTIGRHLGKCTVASPKDLWKM